MAHDLGSLTMTHLNLYHQFGSTRRCVGCGCLVHARRLVRPAAAAADGAGPEVTETVHQRWFGHVWSRVICLGVFWRVFKGETNLDGCAFNLMRVHLFLDSSKPSSRLLALRLAFKSKAFQDRQPILIPRLKDLGSLPK